MKLLTALSTPVGRQNEIKLWEKSTKFDNARSDVDEAGVFVFRSGHSNINHVFSALWKYHDEMCESSPLWKTRIVSLAGAIGGRGIRYKGVDHEFVLTDMCVVAHRASPLGCIGRRWEAVGGGGWWWW